MLAGKLGDVLDGQMVDVLALRLDVSLMWRLVGRKISPLWGRLMCRLGGW